MAYGERLKDGKNLLGFIDKNGHFITEKYSDQDYIKGIKINGPIVICIGTCLLYTSPSPRDFG